MATESIKPGANEIAVKFPTAAASSLHGHLLSGMELDEEEDFSGALEEALETEAEDDKETDLEHGHVVVLMSPHAARTLKQSLENKQQLETSMKNDITARIQRAMAEQKHLAPKPVSITPPANKADAGDEA